MKDRQELDAIVNEVVAEARISRSLLLPEEIDYIRDHVLKKPLRDSHLGLGRGRRHYPAGCSFRQ